MSFYNLFEATKYFTEQRRKEEARDPKITNRWSRALPAAVGIAARITTGSDHAGHAADLATTVALESNPKLKRKAGETARDIAENMILGPKAVVIIARAIFDSGKK